MRIILVTLMMLILTEFCHGADIAHVVMFIVEHNPEISEMKRINDSILNLVKVEAKGAASYGQLTREGASTVDQAKTRYDVGITASIPLISPMEKSQRRIDIANKKLSLSKEASELTGQYLSEREFIAYEETILQSSYSELQWIGKRVEAGVDHQKDYNTKLQAYTERRRDLETRKLTNTALLEKILSYVPHEHRADLKRLLDEAVSQDIQER